MRRSPTAPMTPMLLRLGMRPSSSTRGMRSLYRTRRTSLSGWTPFQTPCSLVGETTATRPGWIAHVLRHDVHARSRRGGNSLEVPACRPIALLALPSMAPIQETEGTSRTISVTCTTCTTSRMIHGASSSAGRGHDMHGVGQPRKRGRPRGTQEAFPRTRQRGGTSMDEALAAVNAGTLELFSTAAARAPLPD
jgi:hypothetical protein